MLFHADCILYITQGQYFNCINFLAFSSSILVYSLYLCFSRLGRSSMSLLYFCLLVSLISPPMFLVWLEYIVHAWTCLLLLKTPQLLPTAPGIKANVLNVSLFLPAQPDCSHTFFQPQWPLCSSLFLGILCPTTGPLHLLFLPLTELKFNEQSHHLQTVTSCLSNSLRLRSDFSYTFNLQIKSLRSTEGQMPPICI